MFEGMLPEAQAFVFKVKNNNNIKLIEDKHNCVFKVVGAPRSLTLNLTGENLNISMYIPLIYKENEVLLIEAASGVVRAVNNFFLVKEDSELPYYEAIHRILSGNPIGILPKDYVKASSYMNCLGKTVDRNALISTFMMMSRAIDLIINAMPLYTTDMGSWAKNQRLVLIDDEYMTKRNPNDELVYHVEKNKKYYDRGWTSIGLSDSSLAGKNMIMKQGLSKLIPFGEKFHNPQRNLYSTLGMLGDEEPLLKTKSLYELSQKGTCWTGWNLFTLFVDVPDVWEDQILVNSVHKDKYIEKTKTIACLGRVIPKLHDEILTGDVLAIHNYKPVHFEIECDSAYIQDICPRTDIIHGTPVDVTAVTIKYKRFFKDGTKITNMAANKGVMRLKDLGYAIDPRTGDSRRIDVIVSAKAVQKRKNYGQLLEAIFNTLNEEQPAVIEDNAMTSQEKIQELMVKRGFSSDCTWDCKTPFGDLKGVCGVVFWGVTHDADDTSWEERDVQRESLVGIRKKGLKFSPIEFKALETRFGKNNPISKEILSYSQGIEFVKEGLKVIESALGKNRDAILPTIPLDKVKNVEYSNGEMLSEEALLDTIADKNYMKDGFYIELPVRYKTHFDEFRKLLYEGLYLGEEDPNPDLEIYMSNKLYVPNGMLRACWKHPSLPLYGMSSVTYRLKALLSAGVRFLNRKKDDFIPFVIFNKAVYNYVHEMARALGGKKGYISCFGMSVRYPYSSKGVAALSNDLPKNTVEIHKSMANALRVETGDIVLVERFPCFGFMSLRPQKVQVTEDPACKYTIRASGNSLGSLSLDFDGDVLYLASFHTEAAKSALKKEWSNPNKTCYDAIQRLNNKMSAPSTRQMVLSDYKITPFDKQTRESHASIVESLTGVKAHTGPVVALAYNIMRIMENSSTKHNTKINVGIELFLDRVANSVFKQKHGSKSLHTIVTDAICTADVKTLVKEGFDEATSTRICAVIREKAAKLGFTDLVTFHKNSKEEKRSNIISLIVRKQNKIYFACRSNQHPLAIIEHLAADAVDIPSELFKGMLDKEPGATYTKRQAEQDNKVAKTLSTRDFTEKCEHLFNYVDQIFGGFSNERRNEKSGTIN